MGLSLFQSTLPHGSDRVQCGEQAAAIQISIHAPSRERPYTVVTCTAPAKISIHAPSRERQKITNLGFRCLHISIHAPSRERQRRPADSLLRRYFNPRSLTGATACASGTFNNISVFQSTLPYGSDGNDDDKKVFGYQISIHAPLRERQRLTHLSYTSLEDFNPRSLTGATSLAMQDDLVNMQFQSTLPYGSDH